MPASTQDRGVYVATATFMCEIDGEQIRVDKGKTRVRAGHVLIDRYGGSFAPVENGVQYEVEQATAAPGERRGTPPAEAPRADGRRRVKIDESA